jgi:hypothetical protein
MNNIEEKYIEHNYSLDKSRKSSSDYQMERSNIETHINDSFY